LRDILALHADEVFSLENRKFQLKMSAEERRHEVEVHRWVGEGGGVMACMRCFSSTSVKQPRQAQEEW
jgi:hypothetical protein